MVRCSLCRCIVVVKLFVDSIFISGGINPPARIFPSLLLNAKSYSCILFITHCLLRITHLHYDFSQLWLVNGYSATFPAAKTAEKCLLIFYSLLMDVIDDLLLIGLLSYGRFKPCHRTL